MNFFKLFQSCSTKPELIKPEALFVLELMLVKLDILSLINFKQSCTLFNHLLNNQLLRVIKNVILEMNKPRLYKTISAGSRFITAVQNHIEILDSISQTNHILKSMTYHNWIQDFQLANNGRLVATDGSSLWVWDLSTGEQLIEHWRCFRKNIEKIDILSNDHVLAWTREGNKLSIFSIGIPEIATDKNVQYHRSNEARVLAL